MALAPEAPVQSDHRDTPMAKPCSGSVAPEFWSGQSTRHTYEPPKWSRLSQ